MRGQLLPSRMSSLTALAEEDWRKSRSRAAFGLSLRCETPRLFGVYLGEDFGRRHWAGRANQTVDRAGGAARCGRLRLNIWLVRSYAERDRWEGTAVFVAPCPMRSHLPVLPDLGFAKA